MGVEQTGASVLVVEDDRSMGKVIRFNLEEDGHRVTLVDRGDRAVAVLSDASTRPFDLVLTDLKLPGVDGMEVLRVAQQHHPDVPVVLVTAFGSVEQAIEAMEAGAADHITKPFKRREFKARIANNLKRAVLQRENRLLRQQVQGRRDAPQLLSASKRMQAVLQVIDRIAPTSASILITGESGTGKELAARLVHASSERASGPFVPLNCAALPATLLEDELFGHERGAFTGADRFRPGRFEQADTGTLFLDEIGELPLELQSKLLRVLDEGVIDRIGGTKRIAVDVRIVAATNREMRAEVEQGRFRADLYHRLGVVPVELPPLRDRPEDIGPLARHFVVEAAPNADIALAPALIEELERRPWPGNVRELKNLTSRMVLLRRSDVLDLVDLAPPGTAAHTPDSDHQTDTDAGSGAPHSPSGPFRPGSLVLPAQNFSLTELEREIVQKAVAQFDGNRSAAARFLGIPRHKLLYRLKKYEREDGD